MSWPGRGRPACARRPSPNCSVGRPRTSRTSCAGSSVGRSGRARWTRPCSTRWPRRPGSRCRGSAGRSCSGVRPARSRWRHLTGGRRRDRSSSTSSVQTPVRPMLASSAPDVAAALEKLGTGTPVGIDVKLDGIRIQAHKSTGADGVIVVRLFTRSLDDATARLPEVVEQVRRTCRFERRSWTARCWPSTSPDARARSRRPPRAPPPTARSATVVSAFFFDALLIDDDVLIDEPLAERLRRLDEIVRPEHRLARTVTADPVHGARVLRCRPGRGPGRCRGQGARRPVRGRAARGRLDQGQTAAHSRPGRAGGGVGQRPAARLSCPTSTWAPAIRIPAAGSCSARRSRA